MRLTDWLALAAFAVLLYLCFSRRDPSGKDRGRCVGKTGRAKRSRRWEEIQKVLAALTQLVAFLRAVIDMAKDIISWL